MKRHVIVGGGLSGALLAWRLSHYYRENVTLIECGDVLLEESYRHYSPKDWFDASLQESSIGHIVTIPQENLGNRTMIYSRGSGIGGTSNINAMIWSLGSTAIFRNHWPPFWANNIESLFKEVESVLHPTEYEVGDQSLFADITSCSIEISKMLCNETERHMIGDILSSSISEGRLEILRNTTARQVIVDRNNRAIGVSVSYNGIKPQDILTENGGEVILCAGCLETPRILLRSSLTRPKSLIPPQSECIEFPLQDHVILPLIMLRIGSFWSNKKLPLPGNGIHGWLYLDELGNIQSSAMACNDPSSAQILLIDGRIASSMLPELLFPQLPGCPRYTRYIRPCLSSLMKEISTWRIVIWLLSFVVGALICIVNPKSIGVVSFHGKDFSDTKLDPRLLSKEEDRERLKLGFFKARMLFRNWCFLEVFPGPFFLYCFNEILQNLYISLFSHSYFHPCGVLPMNYKSGLFSVNEFGQVSVLNDEKDYDEIPNLRISDASIIPKIPSCPIQGTCCAVCFGIADHINK